MCDVEYAMPKKLSSGNKHLLKLIRRGAVGLEGWAPVSSVVAPLFKPDARDPMPAELFELEAVDNGASYRARLTEKGEAILDAMAYL